MIRNLVKVFNKVKSEACIETCFLNEIMFILDPNYLYIPHDRRVQVSLHCPPMTRGYLSTESSVIVIIPSVHCSQITFKHEKEMEKFSPRF